MEEFAGRGDPSNTKAGFQLGTLARRSCPLSLGATSVCDLDWVVLATLSPFLGSVSLEETSRPSSITSFPFPFLVYSFLLGVMGSRERREF